MHASLRLARPSDGARRIAAVLVIVAAACAGPGEESEETPPPAEAEAPGTALSDEERAAVAAADQAYADAWLTNDPDAVIATLAPDAVVVPSGMDPLHDEAAIRDFWFPPDAPPAVIEEYTLDQEQIGGSGEFAFVRGSFTLAFEWDGEPYRSRGTYLSILRRDADGEWRIAVRSWSDVERTP